MTTRLWQCDEAIAFRQLKATPPAHTHTDKHIYIHTCIIFYCPTNPCGSNQHNPGGLTVAGTRRCVAEQIPCLVAWIGSTISWDPIHLSELDQIWHTNMYIYICDMKMCVYMYVYMYIYMYISVCVCVYVCAEVCLKGCEHVWIIFSNRL